MRSKIRTLMSDSGILGEQFESVVELGFDTISDFDTGSLVQVTPDFKDVFVRSRRDDVAAHEGGRCPLSQSAFFS